MIPTFTTIDFLQVEVFAEARSRIEVLCDVDPEIWATILQFYQGGISRIAYEIKIIY